MELTPENRKVIVDLLEDYAGQRINEDREWRLPTVLAGVARHHGFASLNDLGKSIRQGAKPELACEIAEALLNNETYFFRDISLFKAISDNVLPVLHESRATSRSLKIWSAGCSTGQEALSLAMLILEGGGLWRGWNVSIKGTDISNKVLEAAHAAYFNQFEIQRGLPISRLLSYFDQDGQRWQAKEQLRNMVNFELGNILAPNNKGDKFDIIFCRNVLLYFTPERRKIALNHIANDLTHDGVLVLGTGESPAEFSDRFAPDSRAPGAFHLAKNS